MENPSFCRDFRMSCCTLRGTPIDATRSHSSLLLSLLPTGITMPTQTGFCSSQISWSSGVGQTLICLLCVMNLSGACLGREVSSISWSFLLSENVSELSLTGQAFPESWKHAQQERKTHKISKIQAAFHLALNELALVESLFYLCFTFASISTPNPQMWWSLCQSHYWKELNLLISMNNLCQNLRFTTWCIMTHWFTTS